MTLLATLTKLLPKIKEKRDPAFTNYLSNLQPTTPGWVHKQEIIVRHQYLEKQQIDERE